MFQKLKANGFNTVRYPPRAWMLRASVRRALTWTYSIYFFWTYHSAAKGVYDFETPGKNLQHLFDAAKDAGLWVIARAGPYCNVRFMTMILFRTDIEQGRNQWRRIGSLGLRWQHG